MGKKSNTPTITWAQLRFSIIGGLLARPPCKGQLGKELQILASRHYRHPSQDRWITFGVSTLERWYYKALSATDPIAALGRKQRSDAGQAKAMSPQLLAALQSQYQRYPDWSYQLHCDNLAALVEQQPQLADAPSYSTVIRRMQQRGWYKKKQSGANRAPGKNWPPSALNSARCEALSPNMSTPCGTLIFIKDDASSMSTVVGTHRWHCVCSMTAPGCAVIFSGT